MASSQRTTLALLGLTCTLPFLQPRHTHPITSFYSEWLALALGAAAMLAFAFSATGAAVRVPRIAWAPIALAAVVLTQQAVLDLPYTQPSLWAAAYLLWAAMLMIVTAFVRDRIGATRTAEVVAAFLVTGACVSTVLAIVQYYTAPGALEPFVATRLGLAVYGNLGQPNHFAHHAALGLASLAFLYGARRLRAGVAWTISAPLFFALALSGSRSVWLYLIAIVVVALVAYRHDATVHMRRAFVFALWLIPAFIAAHGVVAVVASQPTETTLGRWVDLWAAPSDRLQLWREALGVFSDNPWLGAGWGQFASRHFLFDGGANGAQLTGLYNNAHNLVLQLLSETGIAGCAVVVAGVVLWVAANRRFLAAESGWWVAASLAIVFIHSMLEYPLWNAYFLGVTAVLLALGESRHAGSIGLSAARCAFFALGAVSAIVLGATMRDYRQLEAAMAAAAAPATRGSIVLEPYADLARVRAMTLDRHDIERKLRLAERVMRYLPTGATAYRYAQLLALFGEFEHALRVATLAARHYPVMLREYVTVAERIESSEPGAHGRYADALRALLVRQNAARSNGVQ